MSAYAFTPIRDVRLGEASVEVEHRADGTALVRSKQPLPPYYAKLSEPLERWAREAPDRLFFAQRGSDGAWRELTYAATLAKVRSLASAMVRRGLSQERPVLILSGNDLEHLLVKLACHYAGVPVVPVSPSYSLLSTDFGKLKHIFQQTTPGLVFATDGTAFARALDGVVPADVEIAVAANPPAHRKVTMFEELLATVAGPETDAANAAVGPETVAKFLFTSGSTGLPKGVINTHQMICANQAMILASFPFLGDEPPVIVDWLPWNHTFGGNHNIGIVLFNGGTYYIDDGKPTPAGIEETVRNLREVAPTVYFNVPKGFEALIPYLKHEPQLREKFYSRLKMLFFAGAGMPQHVWDDLDMLALQACGERIVIMTGLGATESGPSAMFCSKDMMRMSGAIGLPVPGIVLKLTPVDGKLEARLKGPSITQGYWRQPDTTAASFDEEGFYKLGDAVRFADPDDPRKGFFFDGRISEDFKLLTGTWVRVGLLRASLLHVFGAYAKDVVIAGHQQDDISILIFPDFEALKTLSPDLASATGDEIVSHGEVRALFRKKLEEAAAASTGSSTRVERALLMVEPPSIDGHEITDKGSINQRAVLERRAALVDELYSLPLSPRIITLG